MLKFSHDSIVRNGSQHWLVVFHILVSGWEPRYVCFRNGVRKVFWEYELSGPIQEYS